MAHPYSKTKNTVYLQVYITGCPVFVFTKSGNPMQVGKIAQLKGPLLSVK